MRLAMKYVAGVAAVACVLVLTGCRSCDDCHDCTVNGEAAFPTWNAWWK